MTEATIAFKGKVAFVTGAGSGIGLAIAHQLATGGARVMMIDRNGDAAEAGAAAIRANDGEVLSRCLDVSNAAEVEAAVAETVEAFGALHLAVNNAGIEGSRQLLADYDLDAWQAMMAVNLNGVFFGMRRQIPAILAAGGGSIVNVSSVLGMHGRATGSAYSTAKHGVIGMTKSVALEYAAAGVRVNAICPGYIETPLLSTLSAEARDRVVARHPIGRLGTADEVASMATFLLSDAAAFVTGSVHLVDGGYSAG